MSSDSSDSEGHRGGSKLRRKSGSDSEHEQFSGENKGPRTPCSPQSDGSQSRSGSPIAADLTSKSPSSKDSPTQQSRQLSRSHSPDSPSSPLVKRGPRSPPDNLDDDGRSNISSNSSILSQESKKSSKTDDGEISLENGKECKESKPKLSPSKNHFQVPHADDLSDVSDIDDSDGLADEDDKTDEKVVKAVEVKKYPKVREAADFRQQKDRDRQDRAERDKRASLNLDDGEQLDFEAEDQPDVEKEDGECEAGPERKDRGDKENGEEGGEKSGDEGEVKEEGAESLEEGEVSDEGDPKPEKPPICRFYSRGACTWGANCRFLHPGVTDKGNYSMFDVARPMVASANGLGYAPEPRPYPIMIPAHRTASYAPAARRDDPAGVESAWERGLRQAKEMMRKSTKRKESDMDFEEKKMNLSIGQDEMDKENDYYTRAASPVDEPEPWARYSPKVEPEVRRPAVRVVERYEDIIPETPSIYERYDYRRGFDKLHPPEYLLRRDKKYYDEEEVVARKAGKKMVREVISERVERGKRAAPEGGRRPEEWSDPWMRSKSPGRKGHRQRKASYSSGSSSYSGSSSHSSSNSSYSSYSRSRSRSRSISGSGSRSPSRPRRPARSPISTLPIRSKLFPEGKDSKFKPLKSGGTLGEKGGERPTMLMNPPAPTPRRPKERPISPSAMRKVGLNPPAPTPKQRISVKHGGKAGKVRARKSRSTSESGSSGSSSESSHSSYSSSSSSSKGGSPSGPSRPVKKAMDPDERIAAAALKAKGLESAKLASQKSQIKLGEGKREKIGLPTPVLAKKRPAEDTPADPQESPAKKTSRREELLKQLKAVEDAIARKRSKI